MSSSARAVVSPISVAAPSSLDHKQSADLENVRAAGLLRSLPRTLAVPSADPVRAAGQYLQAANLYDLPDQVALRQEVMGRLSQLAKHWVREVTRSMGLGDHMLAEANAEIFTFGSYRLGVHGPGTLGALTAGAVYAPCSELLMCAGADIDALCVGPRHVTREAHFFGTEPHSLLQMLEVRKGSAWLSSSAAVLQANLWLRAAE